MSKNKISIAIHGGAGTIRREDMDESKEMSYRAALQQALDAGYSCLDSGGSALDAVEHAVMVLEDCPLFNAGRGAVFTADERHEMDASIMDGSNIDAGAVAMVDCVQNPISLARKIMHESEHVFMAGEGAILFAKQYNIALRDKEYFYTDFRYQQLKLARESNSIILDHVANQEKKFGTVGAVALDQFGNLAAATSTGGMTNKKFGRIGDTPMIGSGTYADNHTCAVSCTGSGEYFIRANVAFHIHSMMQYGGYNLQDACNHVVHKVLTDIQGDGGVIAVDHHGHVALVFNTEGMYRAYKNNIENYIGIYKD